MVPMAAFYPSGHLLRSARAGLPLVSRRTLTYTPPRRAEGNNNPNNNSINNNATNEADNENKPSMLSSVRNFFGLGSNAPKPKPSRRRPATGTSPMRREGTLGADSIFADEETPQRPSQQPLTEGDQGTAAAAQQDIPIEKRDRYLMQPALDPRPEARKRWERKMVVREIRGRGRVSRTEQIMRTERESLSKSHWFKTSIKKLNPLARQIAGKDIDEAILQMRFSPKKAAKDVLDHLEHAKNVAIVRSGMGIGGAGVATPAATAEGGEAGEAAQKPINIVLKSGQRKKIADPSSIYISQAWVNRGPYGFDWDHRAHGQINRLRPPYTSLSVLLKEEHSRVREWQERETTAQRKRKTDLWTQMPDRKITAQNQYYSW